MEVVDQQTLGPLDRQSQPPRAAVQQPVELGESCDVVLNAPLAQDPSVLVEQTDLVERTAPIEVSAYDLACPGGYDLTCPGRAG